MKICYLLTLYHKFDQAAQLVFRLAAPNTSFVLHIDRRAGPKARDYLNSRLQSIDRIFYAPRVDSRWGSYNGAVAIANCIHTAVRELPDVDRCVLLSGQDYPISSNQNISRFFEENRGREFIEAFPIDITDQKQVGWSPFYRFRRIHFWIGKQRYKLPLLRRGMPNVDVHHGSTWWALTGDAVRYLDIEMKQNRSFNRYLRTGFLVEEVYVPSLIMNSPFAERVTNYNVTFDQWTPDSGPHPKVLDATDFDRLVSSPRLFARKFDLQKDSRILDMLDSHYGPDQAPDRP
jgi:hypothetical protein